MLRIFTRKSFWLYLVIVVLVLSIFSFAQFGPSSTSKIKGLKVALVNEDQGPNGKVIKEKLQDTFDKSDAPIKWVSRSSLHSAKKGMENKDYYAAVIIPENFTEKLTTLQTVNPQAARIELWVNQGMNAQAATAVQTIFAKVSTKLTATISNQTLQAADAHHLKLTPAQAKVLAQPITTETHLMNKVGTHSAGGNAPVLLTMLVWLGGLISSLLMWRTFKKMGNGSLSLRLTVGQTLAGLVLSFTQALTLLTVVSGMMNLHVPDTSNLIWALTFSAFVYYLIQTAVLDWLGFKGWPIVILIWFFGSPLLPYPPEMLNHFFRYWIHSWVPVRFGMDTIKDVLYFGAKADLWTMASILGYIGLGALIFVLGAGWWQGRKNLKSI
ncbi:ABC transporter permease [Sporolactobacillus sp. STCC-11]|uniref:YhgE/Pip domain-containing protein n=1 Tax=Sporolactobacillus caesalpiniae TaxID=3230362 RepID=UPI003397E438